jgi:outer membrane protein assembly factor BamE
MNRLILLVLPCVAACSSSSTNLSMPDITQFITPYRIDVRQGNMVTQEMVAQLRPGQTREQVRFILGTPLVADIFHADRWDYVYRLQTGKGEVQQRRFVVFFDNNKLARVGGDVLTNDAESAAAATAERPAARVIVIPPRDAEKKDEVKVPAKEETDAAKPEATPAATN